MKYKVNDWIKIKGNKNPIMINNVYSDNDGTVYNYHPQYRGNDLGPHYINIKDEEIEFKVKWVKDEQ